MLHVQPLASDVILDLVQSEICRLITHYENFQAPLVHTRTVTRV